MNGWEMTTSEADWYPVAETIESYRALVRHYLSALVTEFLPSRETATEWYGYFNEIRDSLLIFNHRMSSLWQVEGQFIQQIVSYIDRELILILACLAEVKEGDNAGQELAKALEHLRVIEIYLSDLSSNAIHSRLDGDSGSESVLTECISIDDVMIAIQLKEYEDTLEKLATLIADHSHFKDKQLKDSCVLSRKLFLKAGLLAYIEPQLWNFGRALGFDRIHKKLLARIPASSGPYLASIVKRMKSLNESSLLKRDYASLI
jgi:hypothetical protein